MKGVLGQWGVLLDPLRSQTCVNMRTPQRLDVSLTFSTTLKPQGFNHSPEALQPLGSDALRPIRPLINTEILSLDMP